MRRLKFMAALPALLAVPAVLAQAPFVQPRPTRPRSPSATSASKACSASPKARSSTTCRSTSATGSTRAGPRRRCARCTPRLLPRRRAAPRRRHAGVVVLERPSIESFTIDGNKDIKTEDLEKSLRNVGPRARQDLRPSRRSTRSKRFLTDQYFSRGKYGVKVDTKVTELPDNRVKIAIDIVEGKRSRSARSTWSATRPSPTRSCSTQFKLQDAEPGCPGTARTTATRARSCRATSRSCAPTTSTAATPTSTSSPRRWRSRPDRDDMFVTMNVKEGEVYRISEVKIAGNLVVPEEELRALVQVRRGDIYSQRMLTATTELMALRLGADGYAFAKIDPVPQEDPATKEIAITFLVDPGNRVYVRRINFNGTSQHQRRGVAPRDAPDRGRLPVERRGGPLQAAPAAAAVHRGGQGRDHAGAGLRRTSSTSTSRSRRACPASSAAASATPSRSRCC